MTNDNTNETFELCGETFQIEYYPKIYAMVCADKFSAGEQLRSIADAWHEGSITSAAQAIESDLQHG